MITAFLLWGSGFAWSAILHHVANVLVGNQKRTISFPIFELLMTGSLVLLFYVNAYFFAYALFFSALGITFITDFSAMLISRWFSLYLVPVGILLSWYQMFPISWPESIVASLAGYFLLYGINKIFYWYKKQDGLGQGDMDLMALVGAFTGLLGVWFVILVGSLLGVITMFFSKSVKTYVPFGPFLVIGAIFFVVLQIQIEAVVATIFC